MNALRNSMVYNHVHGYYGLTHNNVSVQMYTSHCWIRLENVYGNAAKAVRRKLCRMARTLHLEYLNSNSASADICVNLYSRKDEHRALELVKYASGKKLAKTARNNNNRSR